MGTAPSLNGRVFVGAANDPAGDVGAETRLEYHEESEWESQPGTGTSIDREVVAPAGR